MKKTPVLICQAQPPQKTSNLSRRSFLESLLCGMSVVAVSCRSPRQPKAIASETAAHRFLFVSNGKTLMMNADGTGRRVFDFTVPDQVTWQPSGFFSDGRRILFLSMEERRDGPGRPFDEYYTQTPTHLWIYDLESDALTEIASRNRMAVFYTPELLLGDDRLLVQVVRNRVGQIFNMNLDGTDAREFTHAGEGLPYGTSLSPDGQRVAFHLASPSGYQIWTSDLEGRNRILIAGDKEHLYFGPRWSPNGEWLAYQACRYHADPGHDWADVCVSRPDGSEQQFLTEGQIHWFGATYGGSDRRGGGSNMLAWTRDGAILYSRKLPQSKVPWEYQSQRRDTDHFNRDFKPDLARGGVEIWRLNPNDRASRRLTHCEPAVWDCRASQSDDGELIIFCRAETGRMPGIWIMDSDGGNIRQLTDKLQSGGADHPRWMPTGANLRKPGPP
ncbi:MAG: serine/threonine protein kinase [Verrucomicrobia bacterium]|nr:serine/threonine protein kinase [Verrucomicrobiota bacterium]